MVLRAASSGLYSVLFRFDFLIDTWKAKVFWFDLFVLDFSLKCLWLDLRVMDIRPRHILQLNTSGIFPFVNVAQDK